MSVKSTLTEIGLTDSEAKVYLALLKLGSAAKGAILKETKTAPSKIYHVLEKLQNKGLVSSFLKNKVNHFRAAPPDRINDYLEKKKNSIGEKQKQFEKLLPQLTKLDLKKPSDVTAEIFYGWNGMETAYSELARVAKKGGTHHVLGASEGENVRRTQNFYIRVCRRLVEKKVKIKIIFNEISRDYVKKIEDIVGFKYDARYLPITTPVEISICEDLTAIVRLTEPPLVFLIRDRETAKSFLQYFDALWKQGKK